MAKLSKPTIAAMEAQADRVQAWFDGDPWWHVIDRGLRGVSIPRALLCWGPKYGGGPLALHTSAMPRDYRKHAEKAMLIFWDVDPKDLSTCLSSIELPELCIGCGRSGELRVARHPFPRIETIPERTSYYRIGGALAFGLPVCPDHMTNMPVIEFAHQERARFLTVGLGNIDSSKAYRAITEANRDHAVPYFEARYTQGIPERQLEEALRKRSR